MLMLTSTGNGRTKASAGKYVSRFRCSFVAVGPHHLPTMKREYHSRQVMIADQREAEASQSLLGWIKEGFDRMQ
ncbi:hypothetical protein [Bradyrhizobium prioriisuperbiae]|uniref:hypothetical protein n=1 Tax=Bradyrhizobium prioriisuperbiae TaxID=2854389 RepID=UPI0028ED3661|nr:hypothetical protein [Bradyrhizobium prioritasuperba]